MKDVLRKVVWVVVIIAVLVVIYFVLPEYPQSVVKGLYQPLINTTAKSRINQIKEITDKDIDNLPYKTILEENSKNACWVYTAAADSDDGLEHVIFYGRGLGVNLQDWKDYSGLMYTSAIVKIDFQIKNGKDITIVPYVDDLNTPLYIIDGKHVEDNRKIRVDIFQQMYTGIRSSN